MTTNSDFLAVAYSTFKSAGAICFANELFSLRVVRDLVVNFRARETTDLSTCTDCHSFDCGDRHYRLRELAIEFRIPGRVRAQAWNYAACDNFENAAQRVALCSCLVYERNHSLLSFFVSTVQRSFVGNFGNLVPGEFE